MTRSSGPEQNSSHAILRWQMIFMGLGWTGVSQVVLVVKNLPASADENRV